MNGLRKYLRWFVISLIVFMVSIFLHECGHGLANSLAGIPCSTGFNRVGDIYKFPSAEDFRSYYIRLRLYSWTSASPVHCSCQYQALISMQRQRVVLSGIWAHPLPQGTAFFVLYRALWYFLFRSLREVSM